MLYQTYDEAQQALGEAELDVANDLGLDAVEAGWSDIVHSIASCCPEEVGAELIRRNL